MNKQQLQDYIREQVGADTSRESIRIALGTQGWSEQDINEGFETFERDSKILTNQMPVPPVTSYIENTYGNVGTSEEIVKSIWNKGIPRTNSTFMFISLLLVFGLDLLIAIASPDLLSFWYMMLGVFAGFGFFFFLENFVFRKKFANTTSSLDKWILTAIVLRNIIFLLNFIPLIQLVGIWALASIGWLVGLAYVVLIVVRFRKTKKLA